MPDIQELAAAVRSAYEAYAAACESHEKAGALFHRTLSLKEEASKMLEAAQSDLLKVLMGNA